jgi:hypothetical protein
VTAADIEQIRALFQVSDYQRRGVFAVLGARTFTGSADHGRLLARAHPSGQWIEWLG